MQIDPLTKTDQIKVGDSLLIGDGKAIIPATAIKVLTCDDGDVEVVFNVKLNKFFSVQMYLEGKSWAKDVRVVRMEESTSDNNR